jgi:hypothetical protein
MIFLFICILISPVVILWVRGIDYMNKNHSDYKGEDFLNSDFSDKIN